MYNYKLGEIGYYALGYRDIGPFHGADKRSKNIDTYCVLYISLKIYRPEMPKMQKNTLQKCVTLKFWYAVKNGV